MNQLQNLSALFLILGLVIVLKVFLLFFPERRRSKRTKKIRSESEIESVFYDLKEILSPAEKSFFHVLRSVLPDCFVIFPKVRMADIFSVPRNTSDYYYHFNRIAQKHLDYVICRSDSLRPLFCIELDDRSHSLSSRMRRDGFVDEVCLNAGVRLLRFRCQRYYNLDEVREVLRDVI